ncbi:uncharacterized protein LOC135848548 isoform X2 [Planococcus citri]|uniref:uncharacterized protein LOC135848548 isoform X2 n=1 Tax=Planococcus citri TaxID=170843 RepID=UPI0031F7F933
MSNRGSIGPMSSIITCLTLLSVIYIAHVQANQQDDSSDVDSDIFSSSEKKQLVGFEKKSFQRRRYKKALRQLKKNEATSLQFFSDFGCAVYHGKRVMELDYTAAESYLKLYYIRAIPQDLPEDYQRLNETCDEWLDVVFHRKNPKNKEPPRQKIKSSYLVWYTALSASSSKPSGNPHGYFLNLICTKLQKIRSMKPTVYETDDVIYRRFSASMARSHQIFAGLHGDLLADMSQMGEVNPDMLFDEVLFKLIPKWNMTAEDIAFYNVLINAHLNRPVNATTLIETNFFERGTDDWVCVPTEHSKHCMVLRKRTPPARYSYLPTNIPIP